MEIAGGQEPQNSPDSRHNQMAEAFRNFQQCVHHCQKAVFFTDAAGILQRVNPAFERLTGYSAAECVGKDLSWIAAGGPTGKAYRQLWKDIFENQPFHGTLDVRKKNGSCLPLQLIAIPVHDRKGGISSLVCVGRDPKEEYEQQVKLGETAISAPSTLLRNIVHDLNNALMTISAYAELSLNDLPPEHPLRRNLQEIRSASQRANELGGEMLSLARPEVEQQLIARTRNEKGHGKDLATADRPAPHVLETIMIVEDELVIRKAVVEFLSEEGYQILSAINGYEALEKIQTHPGNIQLVITDINMPRMSGPELAQALAATHPETKILFVSGYSESAEVMKGAAGPGRNFLLKPFAMRTLLEKVRKILGETARARAASASGG